MSSDWGGRVKHLILITQEPNRRKYAVGIADTAGEAETRPKHYSIILRRPLPYIQLSGEKKGPQVRGTTTKGWKRETPTRPTLSPLPQPPPFLYITVHKNLTVDKEISHQTRATLKLIRTCPKRKFLTVS